MSDIERIDECHLLAEQGYRKVPSVEWFNDKFIKMAIDGNIPTTLDMAKRIRCQLLESDDG